MSVEFKVDVSLKEGEIANWQYRTAFALDRFSSRFNQKDFLSKNSRRNIKKFEQKSEEE